MNKFLTVTLVLLALIASSASARRGNSVKNEIKQALGINATQIQDHLDMLFLVGSMYLNSPESQSDIANYLRRARNVASLLDVTSLRSFVLESIDDAFDVIENLRGEFNSTVDRIVNIVHNGTNRQYARNVRSQLQRLQANASAQLEALLNRTQERLTPVVLVHFFAYSAANNETINDVQSLINLAVSSFGKQARSYIRKIQLGVRVFEVLENLLDGKKFDSLDSTVRRIARSLNSQVQELNLTYFRNLSSEAFDALFSSVSVLQNEIVSLADRALLAEANITGLNTSEPFLPADLVTPGTIVSDRLNELREGLGERVVEFRDNAIRRLKRLIRDTLQALGLRNLPSLRDPGFEDAVRSLFANIKSQVEELVSTVNRLYRL